jgi:uncharacterized membrane protein
MCSHAYFAVQITCLLVLWHVISCISVISSICQRLQYFSCHASKVKIGMQSQVERETLQRQFLPSTPSLHQNFGEHAGSDTAPHCPTIFHMWTLYLQI